MSSPWYSKYHHEEPTMSVRTLLVSVEDLIFTAFGSPGNNRVNFKLIQTILHILARQLRLLEQDVEIKFEEFETAREELGYYDSYDDESYSSSSEERDGEAERRRKKDEIRDRKVRAVKEEKEAKKEGRDEDRDEKVKKGEKGGRKGRGKAEKEDGKTSSKDRDGRRRSKDRGEKEKRDRDKSYKDRDGDDGGRERRRRRGEDAGDEGGRKRRRSRGWSGDEDGRPRGRRGEDDGDDVRRERRRKRGEDDGDDVRRERRRKRGDDDGYDVGRERRHRRGDDDGDDDGRERRRRRGDDGEDEYGRERQRRRVRGRERGADGQDRWDRRDFGKQTSGTSITVSESLRGPGERGSILVAERGPASRVRPARIGSIEVVTASQFALLEKAVKQLERITGPLPEPVLPDNETLRQELATGQASLQDTMQAMQLNARMQAAEQGLSRMAELLTQLAQSGMLPPKVADRLGAMKKYLQATDQQQQTLGPELAAAGPSEPSAGGPGKPGAGVVKPGRKRGRSTAASTTATTAASMAASSAASTVASTPCGLGAVSTVSGGGAKNSTAAADAEAEAQSKSGVTHNEMQEVLHHMKEALYKEITNLIARANHSADAASNMTRSVAEKLYIAMQLDARITTLFQQAADYAEQVNGLDSGIMKQVQCFQEQLGMMKSELEGGLALLEAADNNAETAALLDLSERREELVIQLDNTILEHHALHMTQYQISDELANMIKCVEILREQKADRDEVQDGLRDKADISRLAGLLHEKDFAHARMDIETRISKCYEMFDRQDAKWQNALAELMAIADNKGEIVKLMSLRENTETELNAIQKLLQKLEIMLGEPKAALLMRQHARHASCGSCLNRALMDLKDATHGKPLPLPPLRPPPLGAEQKPCYGEVKLAPPDIRDHICHRWVGGSHTQLAGNIVKEKAGKMQLQIRPTKKFEGYGYDGKMYMMEEELQPCVECNKLGTDESGRVLQRRPTLAGAGDQA